MFTCSLETTARNAGIDWSSIPAFTTLHVTVIMQDLSCKAVQRNSQHRYVNIHVAELEAGQIIASQ